MASSAPAPLTVAVTGPTGTFGFGLIPVLEADDRIGRVVGVARRPFDPAEHGWHKLTYRQGDVRDLATLEEAFTDADVVVHLAFLVTGASNDDATREINVGGTLNAFKAAAAAGAKRFVYASSVSAYGFHADNPIGITEEWPTRPADHLFYAQEKAELEQELHTLAAGHPDLDLYVLRPPLVVGPHVIGGKSDLAERLLPLGRRAVALAQRFPLPLPVVAPGLQMQVIHEDDVGTAFLQCIVGAGPPGAYNIAADGLLDGGDIARAMGLSPITFSGNLFHRVMRRAARMSQPSFVPDAATWAEAVSHPIIVDTTKAKAELGWHPSWSAADALESTVTG